MTRHQPLPDGPRRTIYRATRGRAIAFTLVVLAFVAIAALLWAQRPASASLRELPAAIKTSSVAATDSARELVRSATSGPRGAPGIPDSGSSGAGGLGVTDGAVPAGASVFDEELPGVAKLDPALLTAVRRAAEAASADGVRFVVDSGWRSRDYQQHLLDEAVVKYGSAEEAARWVASPDRSEHVHGGAIDLGPADAARWVADHGAAYGLCQIYDNEPWHFELRPSASTNGCPRRFHDPTHDPRMQR